MVLRSLGCVCFFMLTMQGTAFAVETDQDVDEEILVEGDLKVIQSAAL